MCCKLLLPPNSTINITVIMISITDGTGELFPALLIRGDRTSVTSPVIKKGIMSLHMKKLSTAAALLIIIKYFSESFPAVSALS